MQMSFNAAGVTFDNRQSYLSLAARFGIHVLVLEREHANQFDRNAIQIIAGINGQRYQLGFVPRNIAAKLAPIMDRGGYVTVTSAHMLGGQNNMSYGLRLDIQYFEPVQQNPQKDINLRTLTPGYR